MYSSAFLSISFSRSLFPTSSMCALWFLLRCQMQSFIMKNIIQYVSLLYVLRVHIAYVHMDILVYICKYKYIYIYIYTHFKKCILCMQTYIYIYICIHAYVQIHIQIKTYIHKYTYAYTAWVLCKNSLYKNLRGSNPRRAIYFQMYWTHRTWRIWGTLE